MPNNRVRKSRNAELLKFATYERIDRQLIAFAFDLEDLSSEVAELASSAVPNYTGRIQSPGGCRSVNPYEGALFFTRKFPDSHPAEPRNSGTYSRSSSGPLTEFATADLRKSRDAG